MDGQERQERKIYNLKISNQLFSIPLILSIHVNCFSKRAPASVTGREARAL